MKPLRTCAIMLAVALLFLIANRGAFKGYFSADDLNNLAWTSHSSPGHFMEGLLTPRFSETNYRPTGHFVFYALGKTFGLDFRPFVWLIQLLHLANVALLWFLLRRFGAERKGAATGALLFAFHMACFDAYWKPMYVFDLLACFWIMTTLLLYTGRAWWAGIFTFWLAYKSKEIAVALPAFLVAYDYYLGTRRWLRVVPYAAISAWFTVQALAQVATKRTSYTLQFTPEAFLKTLSFYSSEILFIPYAGLALVLVYYFVKNPGVRLGVAGTALLLGPLWFLPERMFSVYLYLPLVGVAIAVAFAADRWRWRVIAVLFALWIPYNYMVMREKRKATLAIADENRPYVEAIGRLHAAHPELLNLVTNAQPQHLESWGVEGALQWFYRSPDFKLARSESEDGRKLLREKGVAVIGWSVVEKKLALAIRDPGQLEFTHFEFGEAAPIWILRDGWLYSGGKFRWTAVRASAELRRPAGARFFEATINISPRQLNDQGTVAIEAVVDGEPLGVRRFTTNGWLTERWALKPDREKVVTIELRFPAPYRPSGHNGEPLGAPVAGFGFIE